MLAVDGVEMTTVDTIGRIRRVHFVQKLSVREIARRLHVSRKAIETEEPVFTYTRVAEPRPKLGGHAAALEQLLGENERKPRSHPVGAALLGKSGG